jgi:hypothetical protein
MAPVISGESFTTLSTDSVTVTWTTDRLATSRVIYDTVSHSTLDMGDPNYGYAFSTSLSDTSPEVINHSVTISGLASGTNYFYRVVSTGSPAAIGSENYFRTFSASGAPASSGNGGAVLGTSTTLPLTTWPTLAYTGPGSTEAATTNVLGTETSATATPSPELSPAPTPQQPGNTGLINWVLGHKKISLGVVLALIVIWFLLAKRKKSSQ